jgi:hypothetical protein
MKYILTINKDIITIATIDDFNKGFNTSYVMDDNLIKLLNNFKIYEILEGTFEGNKKKLNNLLNEIPYTKISDNIFEIEI